MLKLKLQYFSHLMQRASSLEKTLMLESLRAGGEGDDRGCVGWMGSLTQHDMSLSTLQEMVKDGKPGVLQSMESHRVRHNRATKLIYIYIPHFIYLFFDGPLSCFHL